MTTKLITQLLRNLADNIDAGNTNATEEELLEMCGYLGFITDPEGKLSKYLSQKYDQQSFVFWLYRYFQ